MSEIFLYRKAQNSDWVILASWGGCDKILFSILCNKLLRKLILKCQSRKWFEEMRIVQTTILFLALTIQFVCADDKVSAPDFSSYSQTEAFRFFIGEQTNANLNLQHSNILMMVSFYRDDRIGLQYSVSESGWEFDVRNVYDWAHQASHSKQLSQSQMKDLNLAIKDLPSKNVFPPIGQLVVISFKDGTNWITHSYDRTNLPPAVHKIYSIIGERFETKDNIK